MSKNSKHLTILTCLALLVALDIILTRFLSINTQFLRISLGMIPVAIAGIAFGPVWGGLCGAVGDVLGMLIFPSGAYFPGFTLTAALTCDRKLGFSTFLNDPQMASVPVADAQKLFDDMLENQRKWLPAGWFA